MGRKGDIVFMPATAGTGAGTVPDAMIPDEVKRDVEEIYAALKSAGSGRMRVEYDTPEEAAEFEKQVKSYCANRPTDVEVIRALFTTDKEKAKITSGGPLRYRKSPTKNLPKTFLDFRIGDIPVEKEAATKAIKDAVDKVKDAVATPEPVAPTSAKSAGRRK